MAGQNGKKPDVAMQRIIAVGVLIAACILVIFLTGGKNRLEEVRINRLPGAYTEISDAEIIRASGLKMGAQIASIPELTEGVQKGVNGLGCVKFEMIERVSAKCLEITVSAREPIAVIDSAGTYVLIDRDGVVVDIVKSLPTDNILYITGCEILTQEKGREFSVRKKSQLEDIVRIALAVKNGGYTDTYSELNVKNQKDMLLIANTSLIVEIYDGSDIERKLMMADEIIKSGNTTGRIAISGDYAGYAPSEGS